MPKAPRCSTSARVRRPSARLAACLAATLASLSATNALGKPLKLGQPVDDAIERRGETDEYTLRLEAGQVVEIMADFTEQLAGVDFKAKVELLSPSGQLVAESQFLGLDDARDGRIEAYEVERDGAYTVRVQANRDDDRAVFRYTLAADAPTAAYEPYEPGKPVESRVTGGKIDSYALDLQMGDPMFITLVRTGRAAHRLNVAMLGPDGNQLWTKRAPEVREIDTLAQAEGRHKLIVSSPNGEAMPYLLTIGPGAEPPAPIAAATPTEATIDPFGDIDEYTIELTTDGDVEAFVDFTTQLTDADLPAMLRLLGPDRKVLAEGSTSGLADARDHRITGFRTNQAGTHTLQVLPRTVNRNARFGYTLAIDGAGLTTRGNALAIECGTPHEGAVSGGQLETLAFDLQAGAPFAVSIVRQGGAVERLDATLRSPTGDTLWSGKASQMRTLDAVAEAAGDYTLTLRSPDGERVPYIASVACQPAEAAAIEFDSDITDVIDPFGDVDEYALTLEANQTVEIIAAFAGQLTGADFPAQLRVLAADRKVLAEGSVSGLDDNRGARIASFTPPAAGVYTVQVFARTINAEARFKYRLSVTPAE